MANAHISKGARARVLVVVGAIAAISVIVGVSPQPASAAPAPVYGQYCRSGYPIRSVSTSDRVVSFTYDDGPWPTNTAAVMSTFERYGWRADFFMIGNNINRYPDIARSVVRRGHGVHAHSVTHRYGASTIAAEAARSRDILQRVTGVRSTFFRAPGLTRSSTIDRAVYAAGMCNISTGSDLGDWKSPRASAWTLCSRFKRALRPGAIILLHDGGSHRQTVDSVSCMLDHVRRSGYQVVGLGALLSRQYSANPAPQPAPAPSTTCSTSLWGQRGTKVAAAQRALMNSGIYLRGGADGVYGTYTLSAVRTFQAARRLPVTGAVNRATAVALGICPSGSSGGGSTATPTPTPAPAPSAWSTIRVGQRGTEVASMQRAIINSGIRLVGGADGIFGRYTQAALRTYQSRNRLPISGALDQATAVKMRLFTPSGSSPTVRSWTTIRAGQRGSTVASMQRAIIASGIYLLGGADGIFGRYSEAALRRYQSAKRVPVTGVLDQATAIKMGLFTAPPPTTTTTTTTTTTAPPSSTTTSSTTTSSTTTSSTTTSSTTTTTTIEAPTAATIEAPTAATDGDVVWLDDGDRVRSDTESGADGVEIRLVDTVTDDVVQLVNTGPNGEFTLGEVAPGSYRLEVVLTDGRELAAPGVDVSQFVVVSSVDRAGIPERVGTVTFDVAAATSVLGLQLALIDVS